MFDKDYEFKGCHARYVKSLRDDAKVFKRYIDVYMVGAVMGFLNNKTAPIDNNGEETASILTEQFIREKQKCEFLYRLIILLNDNKDNEIVDNPILHDKAFRIDETSPSELRDSMEIFHSYVRGGVEILYQIFEKYTIQDDYYKAIYDLVVNYEEDRKDVAYDEKISDLINGVGGLES